MALEVFHGCFYFALEILDKILEKKYRCDIFHHKISFRQIKLLPVMDTTGFANTVIGSDSVETHPVPVSWKVNVAVPGPIAVTTPPAVIVATAILLLTQVPPEEGSILVVFPIHN